MWIKNRINPITKSPKIKSEKNPAVKKIKSGIPGVTHVPGLSSNSSRIREKSNFLGVLPLFSFVLGGAEFPLSSEN